MTHDKYDQQANKVWEKYCENPMTTSLANLIADAIRQSAQEARRETCNRFIEITKNDTNPIVRDHCKRVADAIRKLNEVTK